jgi:DNA-binding response OmpR family regulator
VLLVDDEDEIRRMLNRALTRVGYRVLQAVNAAEAYEACATEEVDVIVSDVGLPDESGLVLARKLRLRRPDARILLMSGYIDEQADVYPAAANAFLAKPFTLSELVESVDALVALRERE